MISAWFLVLIPIAILFGIMMYCMGEDHGEKRGRESSDQEVTRRVLLSDAIDDEMKVEVLTICNDRIYWNYYEEDEGRGLQGE